MKTIVCTRCGPPEVLQLKEIAKPASKDNDGYPDELVHEFWCLQKRIPFDSPSAK